MRAKLAVHSRKRKKSLFKAAKGYRGGRSRLLRTVKDAVDRAREYSYRDRKVRKRDFRRLWIVRINAAVREHGMNYSQFIYGLKAAKIEMDRKTLAYLAMEEPELFAQVAQTAKTKLAAKAHASSSPLRRYRHYMETCQTDSEVMMTKEPFNYPSTNYRHEKFCKIRKK